jgi:hypothetical protein
MTLRVLFVTGSLEQGRSGVADYIFLLVNELTRRGHRCCCVALNDPFVESLGPNPSLSCAGATADLIRIPAAWPWPTKAEILLTAIRSFSPDFVSLQYVPYAFSSKGIPWRLVHFLKTASKGVRWHVMAHELWLDSGGRFRHLLVGFLQKLIAFRVFYALRPPVVHTSNWWYMRMLDRIGVSASILPLFSNIPYHYVSASCSKTLEWKFVIFGSINRDWIPDELLRRLDVARQWLSVERCQIISIGNISPCGVRTWSHMVHSGYAAFSFLRLGELSSERVSAELQKADFGIAVTPSRLIQKSGSVAAMLSHGLPVIISRLSPNCEAWHQSLTRSGRYILLDSSFESALGAATKFPPVNNLAETATQFIRDLEPAV